jgi:hypothetical protein
MSPNRTILTNPTGTCRYDGCNNPATTIASGQREYDRDRPLEPRQYPTGFYCDYHTAIVTDFHNPEYQTVCPNCLCHFGVN